MSNIGRYQKVITHVCLTRFGLKKFQNEINRLLQNGYEIENFSIEKNFFKIVCYAILTSYNEDGANV